MMGGDDMLKALKSYWAFTNGIYKLVMWVIVPLALVAGYMFTGEENAGNSILFLFALYGVDVASDFFFMNGAYYKEREFSRFLLSSPRYLQFLNGVTVVDIVRRVLVFQIPFVMECIYAIGDEGRTQWCKLHSFLPLLAILVAQCTVLVSRLYIEWVKVHLCITVGVAVMASFFWFLSMFEEHVIDNIFLIIAIFMVSVFTIWYTQKSGKERYYD